MEVLHYTEKKKYTTINSRLTRVLSRRFTTALTLTLSVGKIFMDKTWYILVMEGLHYTEKKRYTHYR